MNLEDALTRHEAHCGGKGRSLGCGRDAGRAESRPSGSPGKVTLTVRLDRHVVSSSPPVQSSTPSQALSSGMNLKERWQKKYLLSISCLTGRNMTTGGVRGQRRRPEQQWT